MATSIDSLSAGLIGIIGNYFESISPTEHRGLDGLDGSSAGVVVIYSASGMPMAVGRSSSSREITRVTGAIPGAQIRTVEVGDEVLSGHLARLIGELFEMPFGIIGPERQASGGDGVPEAPRRRGRKLGGAAKGGRKRGRPARNAEAGEDGAEAPKRRGRRSKSQSAGASVSTTRRRPGRPKKANANGEAEAPKKRGRPFGSKNKPKE